MLFSPGFYHDRSRQLGFWACEHCVGNQSNGAGWRPRIPRLRSTHCRSIVLDTRWNIKRFDRQTFFFCQFRHHEALRGWKRCPGENKRALCVSVVVRMPHIKWASGFIIIIRGRQRMHSVRGYRPTYEHMSCSSFVYRAALGELIERAERWQLD